MDQRTIIESLVKMMQLINHTHKGISPSEAAKTIVSQTDLETSEEAKDLLIIMLSAYCDHTDGNK